jgi:2-succinyl-5-enolpyruvyl-6-hydroxy-3-cyclohexene-1-carboxylate synthase
VLASEEFEALLGTPRGVDAPKAAELFGLPHQRLDSLDDLPDALAAGTGLIEVKVDRKANLDLHRRLAARVAGAVADIH